MGPIGVDNSELINLEIEDEFRERHHYIDNLMGGKPAQNRMTDESISKEDKENLKNERLLQRLTNAAAAAQSNLNISDSKSKINSVMGGGQAR